MYSLQKISVSLICFLLPCRIAAGNIIYRQPPGAGEAGMAYACVMRHGLWSSFYNQAGLPLFGNYAVAFSFENRFGLKELSTRSAGFIIPAGKSAVGAFYSYFGCLDYKRETIGVASGIKLSETVSSGVQIDYLSERTTGDYEDSRMITCEAGLMFDLTGSVKAGIHVFNPVPNSLRNFPLASSIRAGAGVTVSPQLFAAAEVEMITGRKLNLKSGFEYEASKKLIIRGGYSTGEPSFSFGFGCKVKPGILDIAVATHPKLGIISTISIAFNIIK
ncbi:MAG TPA: hypothetical protein PLQ61_04535 [Bacteroidales bacterium]|nr:hypothetical protein [Bacteroidales bacterium]